MTSPETRITLKSPTKTPALDTSRPLWRKSSESLPSPVSFFASSSPSPQPIPSVWVYRINQNGIIRSQRYFPDNFPAFTLDSLHEAFARDQLWEAPELILWTAPGGHSSNLDTHTMVSNLERDLTTTKPRHTIIEVIGKETEPTRCTINPPTLPS